MGKQKKLLSDIGSNVLASAIYDAIKSLWELLWKSKIVFLIAAISSGAFGWFGKVIGWFSNMNAIYTGCVVVLSFIAFFSIISFGVKVATKNRLEIYKGIQFQQHWYQPSLIELAHGVKTKGIGIKLNNKGNKNITNLTVEMKQLFYKKDLSEEFKNISIESQPFWWDLGNNHSTTLEELESTIGHAILMFASPLPVFPQFVFMTSATSPDSNISGIPRYDGYYKVLLQFSGSIKNSRNKMKPILFRAEFRYKDFEFSEYDGQGYVELE